MNLPSYDDLVGVDLSTLDDETILALLRDSATPSQFVEENGRAVRLTTVNAAIKSGELPVLRVGKRRDRRIPRTIGRQWLARRCRVETGDAA